MRVRFKTFEQFHGKRDIGSTYIRVHQLLKYWHDAGLYRYGETPDVLVFQKEFCTQDYKFPAHYPGTKILDICDPCWLEGNLVKETVDAVDAVVCATDNITKFIQQLTDKPIRTIPDRFDLELVPERIKHEKTAEMVVWFGYRHNAETLKPALRLIKELGLKLIVIAQDDPLVWQWLDTIQDAQEFRYASYSFIKYNEDTIYTDLQKADYAILPVGNRPVDHFKSNNKTVKAILAGLPVAKTGDDMRKFMDPKEREAYMERKYDQTREEYDVRKSIEEYKELIGQLMEKRT